MSVIPNRLDAAGDGINLDLEPLIAPYREHPNLAIRIERLPPQARLSNGRDNGDHTWSLTVDDVGNLRYLPPNGMQQSHTLAVTVIGMDADSATTLDKFDLPISSADEPPSVSLNMDSTTHQPSERDTRTGGARANAARRLNQAALSEQPTEMIENNAAAEPARTLRTRGVQDSTARALPERVSELEASFAHELEVRLAKARSACEAEQNERIAAAVKGVERRSRSKIETLRNKAAESEAHFTKELEQRLAEAQSAWEAEQNEQIAAAVKDTEQQSRSEIETLRNKAAESEAHFTKELEQRLAEAQSAWEAEQNEQIAAAVKDTEQQSRSEIETLRNQAAEAEVRFTMELEQQLDEAEEKFETELRQCVDAAVAEAAEKSETKAAACLEQALQDERAEWSQELAAAKARYEEAEAALEEVRLQAKTQADASDVDDQSDAAVAFRERELEWERTRQEFERLAEEKTRHAVELELEAARNNWQIELQDRLSAAEAEAAARLEESRAQWDAERAALLNEAEKNTQARIKSAKKEFLEQIKAMTSKATHRQRGEEASRVVAPKVRWKKILRKAKRGDAIRRARSRYHLSGLLRRLARVAVFGACVTAAILAYPRIEPIVIESWWPKIASYRNQIRPLLHDVSETLKSHLLDLSNDSRPLALITVPVANVRADASTAAAVVAQLYQNAEVTLLERLGNWLRVRVNSSEGKEGWVHQSLLKDGAKPR